jgi:hypothetical protein
MADADLCCTNVKVTSRAALRKAILRKDIGLHSIQLAGVGKSAIVLISPAQELPDPAD